MRMRQPGTPSTAYAHPAPEVCDALDVDAATGLGEAEAARRLALSGPNQPRSDADGSREAGFGTCT